MKVLVLGSGGREHAILWALKRTADTTSGICIARRETAGFQRLLNVFPLRFMTIRPNEFVRRQRD